RSTDHACHSAYGASMRGAPSPPATDRKNAAICDAAAASGAGTQVGSLSIPVFVEVTGANIADGRGALYAYAVMSSLPGPRRILLADADAFFVAVARMADPDGAGRAPLLIVGGRPGGRGVVCSASYETRAYGV